MSRSQRVARAPLCIAVVTGTRSEYGLLRSTLHALNKQSPVRMQIIAAGMHLLPQFGRTEREIVRDGFRISARVPMQRGDDQELDQASGLARGVAGIARALARLKADIVLVLGDRIEALAGALAGATTGRVVAHIHGGDVAEGDFDESVRHAITKLAHLHFVASPAARRRVLAMGEAPERVFLVGAPGLDEIAGALRAPATAGSRPARARAKSTAQSVRRDAATGEYAVVLQHAYGRAAAMEERVMRALLDEVARAGLRRVIIHPNTDRGHRGVLAAIERHARISPAGDVTVHRSLPRSEFIRQIRGAALLIGNSSSGIIEAPFIGTPSVNVGRRQGGREAGGTSVLHADETATSIRRAIINAQKLRRTRDSVRERVSAGTYGDGRAGERIAQILAKQGGRLDVLRRKRWSDRPRTEGR